MAKGPNSGGLILALAVIGGVGSVIANYWRDLLPLGILVVLGWVAYKLFGSKKPAADAPPAATVAPPQTRPQWGGAGRVPVTDPQGTSQDWPGTGSTAPTDRQAPTLRITLGGVDVATTSEPRPPVTSRNGDDFWITPDRRGTICGYAVEGGVYAGQGLASVDNQGTEPALINPNLPIAREGADCSIRMTDYWPSYQWISPVARASYLDWLATGRKRPDADLGYVFLYFYGLERRALFDAADSEAAKAELPWIVTEVERLLSLYGHSGSLRNYAGSFLDLLRYRSYDPRMYEAAPPPLQGYRGTDLGLGHRIALGQCAADGSPLPAAWAFAWFMADPLTHLRTSAKRCPDEFRALFLKRYGEVFGSGLVLPKAKTRLKFERQPASRTFSMLPGNGHTLRFDLPDVSVLTAPVKKLQDIAEWCYPQLDSYSRYVGKGGASKDSFDALLELPLALWPAQHRQVIEKLHTTIVEAQRPAAVPFEKFKARFPAWQVVNKAKLLSLYRVLAEAGLGMEPDVRFGGAIPGPDSTVVLFADDPATAMMAPTPRYTAAALTLQLGAVVALADGTPAESEKSVMAGQLETWLHLGESERRRLHAFTRLVFAGPSKLNGIKAKVEGLDKSQREALGDFLALIAQADGAVTPAEIKTLEKNFRLLGLDPARVYTAVHAATTEPVTVRPAAASTGYAIPKPKAPATAAGGFTLDPARVAALQQDTERVSAILGAIFAGDAPEAEPVVEATAVVEDEPTAAAEPTLLGLTPDQSAFVTVLLTRPQWTRAELEELATDREFMLDGMVEKINDASFEKHNQPLLEGEDPVDLNAEVVRELMQ